MITGAGATGAATRSKLCQSILDRTKGAKSNSPPETAAEISSGVASNTILFCVEVRRSASLKRKSTAKVETNLSKDATNRVVESVAGVSTTGVVVDISRSKRAGLERDLRISTDRGDLSCEFQRRGLIESGGVGRGGILVLLQSSCQSLLRARQGKNELGPELRFPCSSRRSNCKGHSRVQPCRCCVREIDRRGRQSFR